MLVCYDSASLSFFWRILIYIYLGILQLLGIVLSFQTRRIKHTGLRDSKYISAISYLHFKHCACNTGTCDIFSENIHQYWYWDIRVRILHSDYYFLGTYLHS